MGGATGRHAGLGRIIAYSVAQASDNAHIVFKLDSGHFMNYL